MSCMSKKFTKAFTIVEIMIVIVIIGILVSIAGPRYSVGLRRAKARDARNNLLIIHGANAVYRARHANCNFPLPGSATGACGAGAAANLAAINNMNGTGSLNIVANGATYTCLASGVSCTADVPGACNMTVTLGAAITNTTGAMPNCGAGNPCRNSGASCPN